MNTDDLIAILAEDARPLRDGVVPRRLATFAGAGLCASVLLMLAWLPPRPDLQHAMQGLIFWEKSLYTLSFAVVGALAVERLARPGGRTPATAPARSHVRTSTHRTNPSSSCATWSGSSHHPAARCSTHSPAAARRALQRSPRASTAS